MIDYCEFLDKFQFGTISLIRRHMLISITRSNNLLKPYKHITRSQAFNYSIKTNVFWWWLPNDFYVWIIYSGGKNKSAGKISIIRPSSFQFYADHKWQPLSLKLFDDSKNLAMSHSVAFQLYFFVCAKYTSARAAILMFTHCCIFWRFLKYTMNVSRKPVCRLFYCWWQLIVKFLLNSLMTRETTWFPKQLLLVLWTIV